LLGRIFGTVGERLAELGQDRVLIPKQPQQAASAITIQPPPAQQIVYQAAPTATLVYPSAQAVVAKKCRIFGH
jgi:hypothetical protein